MTMSGMPTLILCLIGIVKFAMLVNGRATSALMGLKRQAKSKLKLLTPRF